jgi:hypothetical protein
VINKYDPPVTNDRVKRPALLTEDDVDADNWLIEDLPAKKKARKDRSTSQESGNAFNVLMRNSVSRSTRRSSQSQNQTGTVSGTKSQKSLLESGFTDKIVDVPSDDENDMYIPSSLTSQENRISPCTVRTQESRGSINRPQNGLDSGRTSLESVRSSSSQAPPENVFKIIIDDKYISVEFSPEERSSKTVDWLENHAGLQYAL